jgi:hypothetical protein
MRRKALALSFFIFALVAVAAVSQGVPSAQAQGDVPTGRVSRAEYPGADNLFVVSQWCLPDGNVGIEIRWQSYNLGNQWIDMSHSNNGWIFGTFVGLGPFAPWESSLVPWFGIRPGAATFIRVNTNIGGFWYPSQTIQFTTAFCAPQQSQDSDGDGVPNFQDACPFQFGPSWNNGCPVQQGQDSDGDGIPNNQDACPFQWGPSWNNGCPTGGGTGNCDPVTGWCPGQQPPASRCPAQPQILIFPPPPGGCVWPTKGLSSHYSQGENIVFCFWPNGQPSQVRLTIQIDAAAENTILDVPDDGRGDCFDPVGTVGAPNATRTIRMYVNGTLVDTETYFVP